MADIGNWPTSSGDAALITGDTADTTVNDATANASSTVMKLIHTYNAGAGSAGIGTQVLHQAEDATNGTVVTAVATRAVLTTVTAGAEVGAWRVGVANNGLPAEGSEQMRLSGTGDLVVTNSVSVGIATATNIALLVDAARTIASADQATWGGTKIVGTVCTLTGNTNVTSSSGLNLMQVGAPGITSASALTVTNSASLAILGAPIAQGSCTITNSWALWVEGGSTRFDGPLSINAAITVTSAASAVWDGFDVRSATCTVSGSTNITTATGFNGTVFRVPSITAASALTITNAATLTVLGAPSGGGVGPASITNPYAVWVQAGVTRLDGLLGLGGKPANDLLEIYSGGLSFKGTPTFHGSGDGFYGGGGSINVVAAGSVPWSASATALTLTNGVNVAVGTSTGTKFGTSTLQKMAWWNSAPVVQGTVTGSRGSNAALASLLTLLASYGLVVDSSS